MKTLIAVPCMDMMPVGFVQSLLHLKKGPDVGVAFEPNSLVYDSRNKIALAAIEQGFDRVMWIDSDMMFTPDTMHLLADDLDGRSTMGDESITDFDGCEMVTALYFKRRPPSIPVIYSKLEPPQRDESGKMVGRISDYLDYPKNRLFQVRGCGFGCCMTTTKLLKEVWDRFGPAFAPYSWAGEDISFCYRVNQLGYAIWCDSRVSCGHIGTFVYTENSYRR